MRKLIFISAVLLVAAWISAESLGDAARREQERRKKLEDSGQKSHVIDDEIVRTAAPPDPRARPTATSTPEATAAEAEATAAPELDESDLRKQDEATWRKRVASAKARVAQAQAKVDWAGKIWLGDGYEENGKTIVLAAADIQRIRGQAQADLTAAQGTLENVLEQGRRAGVPPGWLDDQR